MWRALALLVLGVGCWGSPEIECRHGATVGALIGGTTTSRYVHLAPPQEAALVGLYFPVDGAWCSGTLIAERAVITAGHCILGGAERREVHLVAGRTAMLAVAAEVVRHPTRDAALLLFDQPPLAGVARPIRFGTRDVVAGELLQVAGHGFDESGAAGLLNLAVEPITGIESESFTVGSDGASGLCDGDSGGAALTRDADGAVVAVGVLNAGSVSCRGTDRYLKATAIVEWVRDTLAGSSLDGGAGEETVFCGNVGAAGRCFGQAAVWCDDGGSVVAESCPAERPCGWSPGRGFRCLERAADACTGYSEMGECMGDTVVACREGAPAESPCAVCGATCGRDPRSGRATCWIPPG